MKIRNGAIRLSKWLNQNTGLILVGIIVFFGASILQFQSDNKKLLENTRTSVENSSTIIRNLEQAVADLKTDNERQSRFIGCLLAIHGGGELVSDEVKAQCEKMSSKVQLEDVKLDQLPENSSNPQPQNNPSDPQSPPQSSQPEPPEEPPKPLIERIIDFISPF